MIFRKKCRCASCKEIFEIFLHSKPAVIGLRCPVCWEVLLVDIEHNKITLINDQVMNELGTIGKSDYINKIIENNKILAKKEYLAKINSINKAIKTSNGEIITKNDVIDLKIELEKTRDVLDFIKKI